MLTGLPAGLRLDRASIDADLQAGQLGYGRSPRQQLETDHRRGALRSPPGITLGTPLTLVVRNLDHKNWTWGMNPWPARRRPRTGRARNRSRSRVRGTRILAGVLKYGHDDVRNALERASARAFDRRLMWPPARWRRRCCGRLGIEVAGRPGSRSAAQPETTACVRQPMPRHGSRHAGRHGRGRPRPRLHRDWARTPRGGSSRRAACCGADGNPGGQRASRWARLGSLASGVAGPRRDRPAGSSPLPTGRAA